MNSANIWDYKDSYRWMEKVNKMPPLIITCAVNGGMQGKEAHPSVPESPDEIAEQAHDAYVAGASCVHIHARNPDCLWESATDAEVYKETNRKIRERCPDIVINDSTGGGFTTTMETRLAYLDALPEVASLNMGPDMSRFTLKERKAPIRHPHEPIEIDSCIPFTYGIIARLAKRMRDAGVKPEMEIYQPGHFWGSRDLIEQGLIDPPYCFQFVMGYQTGIFPTPRNLISLVSELPERSIFSTIGIGKFQWPLTTMSILLGGHVRVGLEDNVYLRRGRQLSGNGEAVEKIVRIARELDREIASPAQAREMLGLSPAPRKY